MPAVLSKLNADDESRISAALALYYEAASLAGLRVNEPSFRDFRDMVKKHAKAGGKAGRAVVAAHLFKFLSDVLFFAAENGRDYLGEDGVAHAKTKTCKVFPFCEADE